MILTTYESAHDTVSKGKLTKWNHPIQFLFRLRLDHLVHLFHLLGQTIDSDFDTSVVPDPSWTLLRLYPHSPLVVVVAVVGIPSIWL